jgi:hypothetical protein
VCIRLAIRTARPVLHQQLPQCVPLAKVAVLVPVEAPDGLDLDWPVVFLAPGSAQELVLRKRLVPQPVQLLALVREPVLVFLALGSSVMRLLSQALVADC